MMRTVATAAAFALAGLTVALACGPFFESFVTVNTVGPTDLVRYRAGELGVVKPTFARRYLVEVYRTIGGVGPIPPTPPWPSAPTTRPPVERWTDIQNRVVIPDLRRSLRPISPARLSADYSSFDNCLDSSFETAIAAFDERLKRYGAARPEVQDWVTAQAAVFQNCGGGPLVLPAAAPADADARLRADRDYQIAAAYFYATQYDEAAGRFRALAANAASPWRASGRYLSARALIRSVTVPSVVKDAPQRLAAAERDLQATLADMEATPLHASARGLLAFIAARARPVERLHELSRRLATSKTIALQDLTDYTRLMDIALGEIGAAPVDVEALTRGDEMTAWIVNTQQRRTDRSLERWKQTRSEPWLVAALWSLPPEHVEAPALIAASGAVPRNSPAFTTSGFLRVRLMIQRGELDAARAALASLPGGPGPGVDAETANLFQAARFAVAGSLDELLTYASRRIVPQFYHVSAEYNAAPPSANDRPVWDDDVAAVFNTRLPLDQLVAAAESTRLSSRLRIRVAQAAFTRAFVLDRPQEAGRAATALRQLAPQLRADLTRYLSAPDRDARTRAGVLMLLRTPGLSINVAGADDDVTYKGTEPRRVFGHAYPRNWWCGVNGQFEHGAASLIAGPDRLPFPPFLGDAQRRATEQEVEALKGLDAPRTYLMAEAIKWARARRTDPDAAEALALSIEGWRWSPCSYGQSAFPGDAFALLHRQFPDSEWAKKTKYWYY